MLWGMLSPACGWPTAPLLCMSAPELKSAAQPISRQQLAPCAPRLSGDCLWSPKAASRLRGRLGNSTSNECSLGSWCAAQPPGFKAFGVEA